MKIKALLPFSVALLMLALLVPAAQAAQRKGVAAHAKQAKAAVSALRRSAASGDEASAATQLQTALTESRRASGRAAALRHAARTRAERLSAANATGSVARLYDFDTESLVGVLPSFSPEFQAELAEAIAQTSALRQRAAEQLAQLIELVPEEARPPLAELIAFLSQDDDALIAQITSLLQSGQFPAELENKLNEALAAIGAALNGNATTLSGLIALLPPELQPQIEQALNQIGVTLPQLEEFLQQLLSGSGVPLGSLVPHDPGEEEGTLTLPCPEKYAAFLPWCVAA